MHGHGWMLTSAETIIALLRPDHQPGYEPGRRRNLRSPKFPAEPCFSSLLPSRDGGACTALAAPIAAAGPSPSVGVDPEHYRRSFRSISVQNTYKSLDTNALARMPAITDVFRLPSSLRSNSNGTTTRHPPIAPSRNLKSPYRSTSDPVNEGMAAGSTRAVSSGSGIQKPKVRDPARRSDASSPQESAGTHNKPSVHILKDVGGHGAGVSKTRATGETSASPALPKPVTNVQDMETSKSKSNTKSQRARFAAEDQRSNNAPSGVPRPNRSGAKDITANTQAAQSSTSLSRPSPQKLPVRIPERKLLFGELPPNASGSSSLGYGIPGCRLSDPSLQSPASTQHRGKVAPTSPPAAAGYGGKQDSTRGKS